MRVADKILCTCFLPSVEATVIIVYCSDIEFWLYSQVHTELFSFSGKYMECCGVSKYRVKCHSLESVLASLSAVKNIRVFLLTERCWYDE